MILKKQQPHRCLDQALKECNAQSKAGMPNNILSYPYVDRHLPVDRKGIMIMSP